MKYTGITQFEHSAPKKVGVLIANLGTPEAPTKQALKLYLRQFLSDPRVIEVPRLLWWCILNGIILNTRSKKSAEAYKHVWTEKGSPLALYTANQASDLQKKLAVQYEDNLVVEWAMRYGRPSVGEAMQKLQEQNCSRILVLPLYPQYSASTTASTFDALAEDFKKRRWIPELRFINSYHDYFPYISALTNQVREFWQQYGRPDKLILSYHGIPLRYFHNGDPYHCQCLKTSRLLAEQLGLEEGQYQTCFQSRFGKEPWLQPYTEETLKQLAREGVKHVQVICPGFASDCLETIEEISEENCNYFLSEGGETFEYIPALNDSPRHIEMLVELIEQNIQGWQINDESNSRVQAQKLCPYNQSHSF